VKLLPGAVSRTGPDVAKSLLLPLKVAQFPPPVPHQLVLTPAAVCWPMTSVAVRAESSSFSGQKLSGCGPDTPEDVPAALELLTDVDLDLGLLAAAVDGSDFGAVSAGAELTTATGAEEGLLAAFFWPWWPKPTP
jgi:hypothetical protein